MIITGDFMDIMTNVVTIMLMIMVIMIEEVGMLLTIIARIADIM